MTADKTAADWRAVMRRFVLAFADICISLSIPIGRGRFGLGLGSCGLHGLHGYPKVLYRGVSRDNNVNHADRAAHLLTAH